MKSLVTALAALMAAALAAPTAFAQPVITDGAVGSAPTPPRAARTQAPLITGLDHAGLAAALQRAGFTAEVKVEGRETFVLGGLDEMPFQAFLGNCQASGGGCTDIQLYAGFTSERRTPWERINGWNNRTRFARAFLDPDGDPAIQMDIGLDAGVASAHLDWQLTMWGGALQTFGGFLLSTPGAAAPPARTTTPATPAAPPARR